MLTGFRLAIVRAGMLTLPGRAMLAISSTWHQWQWLQRWIMALGLSIAFCPVFFYGLRSALSFLIVGPYKMGALLLIAAVVAGWRL